MPCAVNSSAVVSWTSTRNCSFTVRKNLSILPRPWGRPGVECVNRTPSFAQARNSHASTYAEPLSTYSPRGTPRDCTARRNAAANRTVSSAKPHRCPGINREWSSMNANRYVFRPPTRLAVQRVPGPQLVRIARLEPAEHRIAGGAAVRARQLQAVEQPQQRRLRGRPPLRRHQDPLHLRGRAGRVLPFQRRRDLHDVGVGPQRGLPGRGHQRRETTLPPRPYPPIHRVPGIAHPVTERIAVPTLRDPADHHTPRPGRELIIDRRADQLEPEQPDRLRLLQPDPVLPIAAAITHPTSP